VKSSLFPTNPRHNTVFELKAGLYFKFDATLNAWIKVASNTLVLQTATTINDGAMSALDLKKLNRLVLPPPFSSIIGTDCVAPFTGGNISMTSGDDFVGVDGNVSVQNVDSRGSLIAKDLPFQIHQHTYGFDFTIDLPNLVTELRARQQFNMTGKQGAAGQPGKDGIQGPSFILSGPPGKAGEDGEGPPCSLTIGSDDLAAQPHDGMTKGLVAVRMERDAIDPLKYKLVFDRQTLGPTDYAADKFNVRSDTSPWVLAVAADNSSPDITSEIPECDRTIGTGPQKVYYIDIEPLVESIHRQFLKQADILKAGYENIVKFWIQTMSDLFDEQKAALCCALEHCLSVTKSNEMRQHMESTAAMASGSANIVLHSRNSNESVKISSTKLMGQHDGDDMCDNGVAFPQFPNLNTGGIGVPPPPAPAQAQTMSAQAVNAGPQIGQVNRAAINIDPLIHQSSLTGVQVPLLPGEYTAILTKAEAQVDKRHRGNVKIQHQNHGVRKTVEFLDKGEFLTLREGKEAYEGLALSFRHDGGMASFWLPVSLPQMASGQIKVNVEMAKAPAIPQQPVMEQPQPREAKPATVDFNSCQMAVSHLAWYERGWQTGTCCGAVVNVMGQDYIIVKRSIGSDTSCGGGESEITPCIVKMGHPSFAWPTLDGRRFAPLPDAATVTFTYDRKLDELVGSKIAEGEYTDGKGNPAGVRHLSHQLSKVMFPAG
jgi:hypothetical protein